MELFLTFSDELGFAFGTGDTDLTFSSGNPYLLLTGGAFVKMVDLLLFPVLFHLVLFYHHTVFPVQVFLVFCIPLADVAGEHTKIGIYKHRNGKKVEKGESAEQGDYQ